ncbi:MAG: glycosyltransferase [Ruminococcus sp.]|nr:glycosyltransferase [Ruminococcus sp.]
MSDYLVTVLCLSYNHEKYIRTTLEGFVNQKTTFRFKVVVHDDASTDGSQDIIREYAEKYPDMFDLVLQEENKYQQGIDFEDEYMFPRVEGKYVAVCEGDDYWTDPEKLQLQVDYMEKHPDCSLCVHNTDKIAEDGSSLGLNFNKSKKEKDYTVNDIILAEPNSYFHFSSFMWRAETMKRKNEAFSMGGIGDYPMKLYFGTLGYIHYIPRTMSCYRMNAVGSWSSMMNSDNRKRIAQHNSIISGFRSIDEYTGHKYSPAIKKAIARESAKVMVMEKNYGALLKSPGCMAALLKMLADKTAVTVSEKVQAVRSR